MLAGSTYVLFISTPIVHHQKKSGEFRAKVFDKQRQPIAPPDESIPKGAIVSVLGGARGAVGRERKVRRHVAGRAVKNQVLSLRC